MNSGLIVTVQFKCVIMMCIGFALGKLSQISRRHNR
jgi:hypothetical protein